MTPQQDTIYIVITTIIGGFTGLATYLNFRTLREIRKQRENTYRPEILPSNVAIAFYTQYYNGVYLPFLYAAKEIEHFEQGDSLSRVISLKLFNVGFAAAKKVEYVWSYDVQRFIALINSVKITDFFKIEYKGGGHSDDTLSISIPTHDYKHFYFTTFQEKISELNCNRQYLIGQKGILVF